MWLEEPKRATILATLTKWLRASDKSRASVPFEEFYSVVSKLRHAFIAIPNGNGLLSPCNALMKKEPKLVFFHRNKILRTTVKDY